MQYVFLRMKFRKNSSDLSLGFEAMTVFGPYWTRRNARTELNIQRRLDKVLEPDVRYFYDTKKLQEVAQA